nr:MAG TPA: hypothetical protein [Caudoviricetes sp.]
MEVSSSSGRIAPARKIVDSPVSRTTLSHITLHLS